MRSFTNLLTNEIIKMIKRRSFLIAAAITVVLSIGFAFMFKALDFPVESGLNYAAQMMTLKGMGQVLTLVIIICTAGIVAKEHSQGTIKFLLIRSQSRGMILASKYAAVVLFALFMIVLSMAVSCVAGLAVFGYSSASNPFGDVLQISLNTFIFAAVYATLAFMVGILTRSSGAATGIGMTMVFLSGLIIPKAFYKYVLFANADLSVYMQDNPPLAGMSLSFSMLVLAAYVAVFLTIGFTVFIKRDVA